MAVFLQAGKELPPTSDQFSLSFDWCKTQKKKLVQVASKEAASRFLFDVLCSIARHLAPYVGVTQRQ
jgi:hypothetical protein